MRQSCIQQDNNIQGPMRFSNSWIPDAIFNGGGYLGVTHGTTLAIDAFCSRCLRTCSAWKPFVFWRTHKTKILAGCRLYHDRHQPDCFETIRLVLFFKTLYASIAISLLPRHAAEVILRLITLQNKTA